MKKKTAKAGDSGKKKAGRKGAKGAGKGELSPMGRLEASIEAWRKERERNPPKTDYVLPTGEMLPVPARSLTTEKDVLGMYDHLHEFCANSVAPGDFFYRAHAHPIECLLMMYRCSCVSLKEMMDILRIPVQIRLLHERLFRQDLLNRFPFHQFIVEFVVLLQFILRLHGRIVPKTQLPRRYCYCWHTYEVPPGKRPFPRDLIADSYELRLSRDKAFLSEWEKLRISIPAAKWAYCTYQDWFLVFDDQGSYDQRLTDSLLHGTYAAEGEGDFASASPEVTAMNEDLRAFCEKWALTHLGTSFEEDESEPPVVFRAERVEAMPKREKGSSFVNTLSPNGFEIRLPKYYGFDHMPRHLKEDFVQLKYAFDMVKKLRQRKAISEMPANKKKRLLRTLRDVLIRNGMPKGDAYRILKGVCFPIADSTMHGLGFDSSYVPSKFVDKRDEVVPVKMPEAFFGVVKAVAKNRDDQEAALKVFAKFGVDVELHLCEMPENRA